MTASTATASRGRAALGALVTRVGHGDECDGSVPLGVEEFVVVVGIAGVAFAVEDGVVVGFLRFVVEDENDLALGVDSGVVVIVEFRSCYSETSEDDGALAGDFVGEG